MSWILAVVVLVGCQQDLVLAAGDLTGVAAAAARGRAKPAPEEAIVFELPSEQPDIVVVPLEGTTGVGGAAREGADGTNAGGAPPDGRFNPVSVPQGPLEGTGVRFEGVRGKALTGGLKSPGQLNEFRRR